MCLEFFTLDNASKCFIFDLTRRDVLNFVTSDLFSYASVVCDYSQFSNVDVFYMHMS